MKSLKIREKPGNNFLRLIIKESKEMGGVAKKSTRTPRLAVVGREVVHQKEGGVLERSP